MSADPLQLVDLVERKRRCGLSITHIFIAEGKVDGDVSEASEAAPHDDIARDWVMGAGKITAYRAVRVG